MMASLLTALENIRLFNQGLTLTLLFVFVFVFCSISNKLNTYFFFEFILLIIVREGFLLTYFTWILWNQIKCNEICIKLCFMKCSERNISQCILALSNLFPSQHCPHLYLGVFSPNILVLFLDRNNKFINISQNWYTVVIRSVRKTFAAFWLETSQSSFTCSMSTMEAIEQYVKLSQN